MKPDLLGEVADHSFRLCGPEVALEERGEACVGAEGAVLVKVLIEETVDASDSALLLGLPKHVLVPLPQTVLGGRALLRRVAVEDIGVAALGRARPDERTAKAVAPGVLQVRLEDLAVRRGAGVERAHEANTVEVRHVQAVGVRRRAVRAILLRVQREDANVDTVDALEHEHYALAVGQG